MVVHIFYRSGHIPERLIDIIAEVREGVVFYKADTYEEATELLDQFTPHAVLLDLDFPGNSLIELLKKIRTLNEKIMVIVLFSIADEYKLKLCKQHGADFLFDKYHEFEKIPAVLVGLPAS